MPFNIEKFRSNVAKYEYLQTNKFELYISDPDVSGTGADLSYQSNISELTSLLKFRCHAVTAPGIELITAEAFRYGIGPPQKQVWNAMFNDITVSFICDMNGYIWKYFHMWLNKIFRHAPYDGSGSYRHPIYVSKYKNVYSTQMQLIVYDNYGGIGRQINFYDAYPIAIQEIPLDWDDVNNLLKINVKMTYKEFSIIAPR